MKSISACQLFLSQRACIQRCFLCNHPFNTAVSALLNWRNISAGRVLSILRLFEKARKDEYNMEERERQGEIITSCHQQAWRHQHALGIHRVGEFRFKYM
jgi:hypothetical protein